jgi:hypothetical protein
MLKRLAAVWIDYRTHHISEVVAKCLLGALLFTVPVVPAAAHTYTTHHKKPAVTKTAPAQPAVKPKAKPPAKKTAAAKPPVVAASTPAPVSQPPVETPKPTPVPVTQPSPGSGAKKLSPAPATTPTQPADTSTPADPTASTSPSNSSPTSSPDPGTNSTTPDYATGGYTSTNWSGYVATAGGYKHISSSWVAPDATGNGSTTTADSTWIGIGGVFSDDLIQTGTMNLVSAGGRVTSAAFYEVLPDPAMEIPSIDVSPGDSMTATIDEVSAGSWTISITDVSTGQNFITTLSYTSSYSTAEWIEEDPSYASGGLVPFDNFSPAKFFSGKTTRNGLPLTISAANGLPITLVDQSGNPLARPTTLSTDGSGFTVYRQ